MDARGSGTRIPYSEPHHLNGDGYLDLVFCGSKNHCERSLASSDPDACRSAVRAEVPSDGARSGAVADLAGDGHDDLVPGMYHNATRWDLFAIIYSASPVGFSERRSPAGRHRAVRPLQWAI